MENGLVLCTLKVNVILGFDGVLCVRDLGICFLASTSATETCETNENLGEIVRN